MSVVSNVKIAEVVTTATSVFNASSVLNVRVVKIAILVIAVLTAPIVTIAMRRPKVSDATQSIMATGLLTASVV